MSHLIRNVLEDTFQLVDDVVANVDEIVSDSVELARRVGRDARRVASAVRDAVATDVRESETDLRDEETGTCDPEPEGRIAGGVVARAPSDEAGAVESAPPAAAPADPLAGIYAWNRVVANRDVACTRCAGAIARGAEGWLGLSDDARSARAWLCPACRESL